MRLTSSPAIGHPAPAGGFPASFPVGRGHTNKMIWQPPQILIDYCRIAVKNIGTTDCRFINLIWSLINGSIGAGNQNTRGGRMRLSPRSYINLIEPPAVYVFDCGCERQVALVKTKNRSRRSVCPIHLARMSHKLLICFKPECRKQFQAPPKSKSSRRYCPDCQYKEEIARRKKYYDLWKSGHKFGQPATGVSIYHSDVDRRQLSEKTEFELQQSLYVPEPRREQRPLLHSWADLDPAVDKVLEYEPGH